MNNSSHKHGKGNGRSMPGSGGDCPGVIEHLSDFLEGDLEPHLLTEIETHLDECEDCQHCMEEIRSTIELIRSNCQHRSLPEDEKASVRGRLWTVLQRHSTEI